MTKRWTVTLLQDKLGYLKMLGNVFKQAKRDQMSLVEFQDIEWVVLPSNFPACEEYTYTRDRGRTPRSAYGAASTMIFEKE